jgi:phage gp37-like protein
MIARNTIKDAIITKLQPLHVSQGGIVKYIDEYNPDIMENLNNLILRCPAIFVSYAGSQPIPQNQNIIKRHIFSIFVLYKSLHSQEASERGCLILLESVENILENNQLGLDILPLEPTGDNFLEEDQGVTMYALTFATKQVYTKEYS